MKKVLVMLAAALALGLFASCENGAKDVNIVDAKNWGKGYEATITGTYTTYTSTLNSTTGKYDFTENKYDVTGFGGTYWDDYKSSNYTEFGIWGCMNYKTTATATDYTNTWINDVALGMGDPRDPQNIKIYKSNGKYYFGRSDINTNESKSVEITVTGNMADKVYTITIPGDKNINNGRSYNGISLTFTRK